MNIKNISNHSLKHILSFLPKPNLLMLRTTSLRFEKTALDLLKQKKLKLIQLSTSDYTSIALFEDEQGRQHLYTWGYNKSGELGLGHNAVVNNPKAINLNFLNGARIKNLALGSQHIIMQTQTKDNENILFVIGNNSKGQLGLGHKNKIKAPQPLDITFLNGAKIKNIGLGGEHTLLQAQTDNGKDIVFGCGANYSCQLGLGHDNYLEDTLKTMNMDFLNGAKIQSIISDMYSNILHAHTANGKDILFSWGRNYEGQLGLGHNNQVSTPQAMNMNFLNGAKVQKILLAHSRSILHARTAENKDIVFSWGRNYEGQLGLGHHNQVSTPQAMNMNFLNGAKIINIGLGNGYTIVQARTVHGKDMLYVWGRNNKGQLGLGHNNDVSTPQAMNMDFLNDAKIVNLSLGSFHCFLQAKTLCGKDLVFSWGLNKFGQLGLGHHHNMNTPQLLTTGPFKPIAHQFAIGRTLRVLNRIKLKDSTLKTLVQNGLNLRQAAIDYHDVARKNSLHFQQGQSNSTSQSSTILNYFNTYKDSQTRKEWHAGYVTGLLDNQIKRERARLAR